jgi:hypothetical protein
MRAESLVSLAALAFTFRPQMLADFKLALSLLILEFKIILITSVVDNSDKAVK